MNETSGNGSSNTKYYGEYYVGPLHPDRPQFGRDPQSPVLRLGQFRVGPGNPTKSTAIKRVDNFGAGFLRAGAKAVFAEGIESASYTIKALFTSNRTMDSVFMSHPSASSVRDFTFKSVRTPPYTAHVDPPKAGKYWRSLIGTRSMTTAQFRAG